MTYFPKNPDLFPVKKNYIYLNNSGVAPLFSGAAQAQEKFNRVRTERGAGAFQEYPRVLEDLHEAAAALTRAQARDFSFVKNTAEGMSLIANGYPWREGDEIISYVHEYPSNHYPWLLQERRGARLRLLSDHPYFPDETRDPAKTRPQGFSLEELETIRTENTRVIALSHVQFTSGFALDLKAIGAYCKEHSIDLVIDAAQSLGSLPLYPEEYNVAAFACSGWKWLLGPLGSGLLYTSPAFREKIRITQAGAETVVQGQDYLNHEWKPHTDGRVFEYSTTEVGNAVALGAALGELHLKNSPEETRAELFRLQDLFLSLIDRERYEPLLWPEANRSGILSLRVSGNPEELSRKLIAEHGLFATSRGDYLRIAPHVYNDEKEIHRAAEILNGL